MYWSQVLEFKKKNVCCNNTKFLGSLHLVGCVLGQLEPEEEEERAMEGAKVI
jgi:hypothetical protein